MPTTAVDLRIDDGIAWVTLDGPDTRNALDATAADALTAACDAIDQDAGVGVAIVTGAGSAFCSGADTAVLNTLRSAHADEIYEGLDTLYEAFRRVGQLAVPTIAAVNGAAVGAGVNLALATDLRIFASGAQLISGFSRIGLHPGGGHLHLLTRAGGHGTAAAAGVFAQPIDADTALRTGVAWAVVPPEQLHETVEKVCAHLAGDPALARALAATLRRTATDDAAWDRSIEIERARQMWSLTRTSREV
ncbi:MAG: enoyl-CoA hydratase-related protein [Actinomycetota bacterium]|nr:enoyl-CoA hydratase-related protein [Actinomycetota bacterium]